MFRKVTQLQGSPLRATDGEIGTVDQFYFDDETWAIRYLVVNTGSWLMGRRVLISPIAVGKTDWESGQMEVGLTKQQVEGSPDIDTHKPVSRQHEAEYLAYYGYPLYWSGPYLWGAMSYPATLATLGSCDGRVGIQGGHSVGRFTSAQHRRGEGLSHRGDRW